MNPTNPRSRAARLACHAGRWRLWLQLALASTGLQKANFKDTVAFSTCVRQDDAFGLALEAPSCRVDAQLK
jgi:hypothetical protein